MTTSKKFTGKSGKIMTLNIHETRMINSGKFVCTLTIPELGKQVTASGSNKVEAYNTALRKIQY